MNILITNDDGIYAEGIRALAKALSTEHDIIMAAPDSQRSGAAHSLTLHAPLNVSRVELEGLESIPAYAVTGTPADCVKLALGNLNVRPDLVVSGINMGANLGTDVFYSGTVAAAMEACILGLPAVAMSICNHEPEHLATAAFWSIKALDVMYPGGALTPTCRLLSVNVPDIPLEKVKGARFVGLCRRQYPLSYNLNEQDGSYSVPPWDLCAENAQEANDYNAICEEFVAMTPLITDMCDYEQLERLQAQIKI